MLISILFQKIVNVQKNNVEVGSRSPVILPQNCMRNVTIKPDPVFRRPSIYPNNGTSSESFKAQLDVSTFNFTYFEELGKYGNLYNVMYRFNITGINKCNVRYLMVCFITKLF